VTDQPAHPRPRPGARRPRRAPPAARRALTVLGALLLALTAATAVAPAASATLPPPEPPVGPPPPPPVVTPPGLPLWAVLVILAGTITLAAATTLITLALHPAATWGRPRTPARPPADPVAGPADAPHSPSAARARGRLPLIPHHRRTS
jgi:hypothetical protein